MNLAEIASSSIADATLRAVGVVGGLLFIWHATKLGDFLDVLRSIADDLHGIRRECDRRRNEEP